MTVLNKIVEYKTLECAARMKVFSLNDAKLKACDQEDVLNFLTHFQKDDLNIIAEVKKASPSKGIICQDFNPVQIAEDYFRFGAKAISVLTDENFFKGHIEYLEKINDQLKKQIPIMRKDFTLFEYQIYEARAYGADAILLIAAILDDYQLKDFKDLANELGMMALIEIHNLEEGTRIIPLNPKLVGINNRNLKTFKTDLNTSYDLLKSLNFIEKPTLISESGLQNQKDLISLKNAGIDGFLIGETFMKTQNPGLALQKIIEG